MKVLFLFFVMGTTPALACSYCAEMEKLKLEFSTVKPEPMNNTTIDKQNQLVDRSLNLMSSVIKKDFPVTDMNRLIPFLGLVIAYDYQNLVADELLPKLKPHADAFFRQLTKMEKEKSITSELADEIRVAVGVAEAVSEVGTDAPKKK